MPILDFREIPLPTSGPGRDQSELFAREFLESLGFRVIVGPDRGADGGRDLIVEEVRPGIVGETRIRWLVSVKHKAHSGASVTADDEPDLHDRVRTHGCQGFLAFYSTVPSTGLTTKLKATGLPFEVEIYDQERLERHLLSPGGLDLARRFFPTSFSKWQKENPSTAKIFSDEPVLFCLHCGKSLLHPAPNGIVVAWEAFSGDGQDGTKHTEHFYWCCKGDCDSALKPRFRKHGIMDGWNSIADLVAPIAYLRFVLALLNERHVEMTYSNEAHKNVKDFLINLFPLVCRDMTELERIRINSLSEVPDYLGGWGRG